MIFDQIQNMAARCDQSNTRSRRVVDGVAQMAPIGAPGSAIWPDATQGLAR